MIKIKSKQSQILYFTAHIIPGLLLTGLCFVEGYPYVAVALVTLSLGFNGSATLTNLQNSQDLSPNYAGEYFPSSGLNHVKTNRKLIKLGSLYGIVNFFGTTAGFLSPLVVAHFTYEKSTFEEWTKIFWIGGGVYIVPALVFMVFGSGEVQKWNDLSDSKEKDMEIKDRYEKKV